jgi:hypothetical protein
LRSSSVVAPRRPKGSKERQKVGDDQWLPCFVQSSRTSTSACYCTNSLLRFDAYEVQFDRRMVCFRFVETMETRFVRSEALLLTIRTIVKRIHFRRWRDDSIVDGAPQIHSRYLSV